MHELSIATALLELCERELEVRGAATLVEVCVAVGELAAVEPELLRFAWQALLQDSRHDGASLEVEFCRARQTCVACGGIEERQPGSWLRLCPNCSSPLQVVGGDELDLLSLTSSSDAAVPER